MLWSDGLGSIAAAAGRHIGAGAAIREAGLFMVRGRTVSLIPKKLTNNRVSNKISLERGPRGEWGPGSARARKKLQFGALDARARGPRTFTPRTPFKGSCV